MEANYRGMKIGPVLCYTRWAADSPVYGSLHTVPNQVELLASFTF